MTPKDAESPPGRRTGTRAAKSSADTELTPRARTAHRDPGEDDLGRVIAERYRLERHIGRGGMGSVFEARAVASGERVAIKLLASAEAPGSRSAQRFLREAKITSRIRHANVVRVIEYGLLREGTPFLVMEYLEGESLAEHLDLVGAVPIAEALRLSAEVLDGLEAAHEAGVIHRDVKPGNVFLARTEGGLSAKLLDFGLSKALGDVATAVLTAPGAVVGTPYYLAPEQARADGKPDPRTDLWAVGVMLYEMLTGRAPFRAPTYRELVEKILASRPEPPSKLRPAIGEAIDAVVMKALTHDKALRFQSAREMSLALRTARASLGAPAATASAWQEPTDVDHAPRRRGSAVSEHALSQAPTTERLPSPRGARGAKKRTTE